MRHLVPVVEQMRAGGFFDRVMDAGPELDRVKEFLRRIAGESHPPYDALQHPKYPRFPGLEHQPFREARDHEGARILERNFETIRREALALAENSSLDYSSAVRNETSPRAWTIYLLYHMGVNVEAVTGSCPETLAIVESLPGACTEYTWGDYVFSALAGGTHLPPHCSIDNFRLRCHLGITVPDGCSIRVGAETRQWQEGKCLVFEDSFEHEVWNRSNSRRIVLIADLWHPGLTPIEVRALTAAFRKSEVRSIFMRDRIGMTDASPQYVRHMEAALEGQDDTPLMREFWSV